MQPLAPVTRRCSTATQLFKRCGPRLAAAIGIAIVFGACSSAATVAGSPSNGEARGSTATPGEQSPGSSGQPTDPASTPEGTPSLVFRVETAGGFVAPDGLLGRLPVVEVLDDGAVYVQGPQVMIYPGPLLPNIQVHVISPAALARLVELAREKDLLRDASYEQPLIADAPTTVITIVSDGHTYTQRAYALGEAVDVDAGMSIADREARANLRAFIDALVNVPSSAIVTPDRAYVAGAYRIFVGPEQPGGDPSLVQQPIEWPLASDLATIGSAVPNAGAERRCIVVEGGDAGALRPLLERANVLTPFVSNGRRFSLIVRPLLPGESGC